jgi:hypothetical protein
MVMLERVYRLRSGLGGADFITAQRQQKMVPAFADINLKSFRPFKGARFRHCEEAEPTKHPLIQ